MLGTNARGVIVLGAALAGLAVTIAFVAAKRAPAVSRPHDAAPARTQISSDWRVRLARCQELAARYQSLWESSNGCEKDDECGAEPRGGIYEGLDGCARFGNRNAPHAHADEVAAEWLKNACAWAEVASADCGIPQAQCRERHCAELPPSDLPRTWIRLSLPAIMSVFAPPDFKETSSPSVDSYLRHFSGAHRAIDLVLDAYASAEGGRDVAIDGHHARELVPRPEEMATVGVALTFSDHWSLAFLWHASPIVHITCEREPGACADNARILASTTFMAEPDVVK